MARAVVVTFPGRPGLQRAPRRSPEAQAIDRRAKAITDAYGPLMVRLGLVLERHPGAFPVLDQMVSELLDGKEPTGLKGGA